MKYKILLANPLLDEEMIQAATDSLRNERFLFGESVVKFEEEFARFIGTKYAVSVNSGTDALLLSLIACNIDKKDVITTSMSFVATSNTIIYAGGKPIFADIELNTHNIDPKEARKKIGGNIGGILPVHLHGYPAKMKEILDLAEEKNLFVIEDVCQAHGAEINGKKTGSFGAAGAFSFFPAKNMTVGGDGGMITTNDEKIYNLTMKLRNGGRISKYEHDILGYTSRLGSAHAAIGRIQLKRLPEWNEKREKIAEIYHKELSNIKKIAMPPKSGNGIKPSNYMFVIATEQRDKLADFLGNNGIETGVHYPIPIHLQPLYKKMFKTREGMYKNSEKLANTCLSLPMYPDLKKEDVKFVCEKIMKFFK
jgi:perosamine synthetase